MNLGLIFSNWRNIKYLITAILAIVLVVTVYIQFLSVPRAEAGALRLLQCPECEHKAVKRVKDINDTNEPATHCEKCNKQVGYAYKCEDCDREFSVVPVDRPSPEDLAKLKTMAKFQYSLQMYKCPNCGSIRTHPMSLPEE